MYALLVKFRGVQLVHAKCKKCKSKKEYVSLRPNELLEIPQNTKKYFVNAEISSQEESLK